MDKLTLAKTVERLAKRDCFDGVGRILVSDFQREMNEAVSGEEIVSAWRDVNPCLEIEQRTRNVILIHFYPREQRSPVDEYTSD